MEDPIVESAEHIMKAEYDRMAWAEAVRQEREVLEEMVRDGKLERGVNAAGEIVYRKKR